MPPNLGVAKVCKSNTKPKKISIFFGFVEMPPNLGVAKVCKSDTKPLVNSHFLWLC